MGSAGVGLHYHHRTAPRWLHYKIRVVHTFFPEREYRPSEQRSGSHNDLICETAERQSGTAFGAWRFRRSGRYIKRLDALEQTRVQVQQKFVTE
jgi:hypothetical protein